MLLKKLIKFSTRTPIFMYSSGYKEHSSHDIITELESNLFKTVTGLSIKYFYLLVSLIVFNRALMNDVVFKFKHHEDSILSYAGIEKIANEEVGNTIQS